MNQLEPDKRTFRHYLIFWGGQLASLAGTNIVNFSLVWWITIQTGSAFFLGISAFFAFGSFILITPIAGVLVDRWSRKKVIIVADSILAMLSLILVILFFLGITNIIHVLLIQLVGGMVGAFHATAVQAIIPIMVPRRHLTRMNSLNYFATAFVQTIGPAIGALVFLIFLGDMARILFIDIGTYLIAIFPAILVTIPAIQKKVQEDKPSFREEFAEGLTFIRSRSGLLTLLSVFTLANFFLPPIFVLLPLYTTINLAFLNLDLAVVYLGILMSLQSASMMIASAIMMVSGGFKRNVIGVVLGLFLGALGMVILALTPVGLFWVAALGIVLVGFTLPVANVSSQTIWQKVVPPEKMGRVFSVRLTIAQFTGPFAFLAAGILAEIFSIPLIFLFFGSIMISFLLLTWVFTGLRHVEEKLEKHEIGKDEVQDQPESDSNSGA
ncbi:MFS transporter [Candidatus Bathyarchaeota archaeon]|nr:MFS transporter [Candidatus Bathyarchaeota archaeon]